MASNKKIKRQDIWLINFDPAIGGEIKKTRPAIIVSNDISNKYSNRVQVIPLTSNVEKCYPPEVIFEFNSQKSKAATDQIKTASTERLVKHLGKIDDFAMFEIEKVLKMQLGLD